MKLFNQQLDNPIGLDISDISVKFVQLSPKGPNLHVDASGDFLLPKGLIEHDVINDEKALAQFLGDMFAQRSRHTGKVSGNSVIASIPESKAYVRVIALPSLSPEELSSAVPLQAEQYIPLSIDEVELDWQVVGEEGGETKVLITATPKEYIERLVRVFRQADIVPKAIEVESAAVARCLIPMGSDSPGTLLMDMDAVRTSLIVYSGKSIQFTSSVPVAGEAVTNAIAVALSVPVEEAEELKRKFGVSLSATTDNKISPEVAKQIAQINQAIDPVLMNLFDEVKNTIKFHEEHSEHSAEDNSQITRIMLCGGSSKIPNITDYFQTKVGEDPYFSGRKLKVSLGDPWLNIIKSGQPPFSRREALSYTTAIGLALRNFIDS